MSSFNPKNQDDKPTYFLLGALWENGKGQLTGSVSIYHAELPGKALLLTPVKKEGSKADMVLMIEKEENDKSENDNFRFLCCLEMRTSCKIGEISYKGTLDDKDMYVFPNGHPEWYKNPDKAPDYLVKYKYVA